MIGIFDSGIGGLTVVKEVLKQLPEYQIVYFGDTARTPYGTKSPETIIKFALQDAQFLVEQGAKLIIVACHTASSVAADELRKNIPVPIFEVVSPAIKKTRLISRNRRIGIIGTTATIRSEIYQKRLQAPESGLEVVTQPCPLFVPLVEEGWTDKPETKMIAKRYLSGLKSKSIDSLILACTHYPLLKDVIQHKVGKKIQLIDPALEVVEEVKKYLKEQPELEQQLSRNHDHKFYLSDITDKTRFIVQEWLKQPINLIKHAIE